MKNTLSIAVIVCDCNSHEIHMYVIIVDLFKNNGFLLILELARLIEHRDPTRCDSDQGKA